MLLRLSFISITMNMQNTYFFSLLQLFLYESETKKLKIRLYKTFHQVGIQFCYAHKYPTKKDINFIKSNKTSHNENYE